MGVSDQFAAGRLRGYVERPSLVLLAFALVYLFVDLVAKIAGISLDPLGIHVLGGQVAISSVFKFVADGLILGLIIGLAGVGLSMTYSILSFANFAHGDYLSVGAFSGWCASYVVALFTLGLSNPLGEIFLLNAPSVVSIAAAPAAVIVGLAVSAAATVAVVLAIDRVVYKPMRDRGSIALLIASIGVALALRYTIVFVWSTSTRGVTAVGVESLPSYSIPIVDYTINLHEITMVVAAVALMLGIHVLLQFTKLGKAMRAMADNKDLAQVTGIPTERVIRATWIIGGGLAGMAGFLIILNRGVLSWNFGWRLLLFIFSGVILGGIGSVYGAIGGGILIGIASRMALIWIPSGFARVAAFTVMILVLLYRPSGLFSGVTTA
jgi:branched-chain amino acid transport system permease protein